MPKNLDFDLAIIGGSYAGMTSALALAKISPLLKIALIEKEPIFTQKKPADGRAYAISAASLRLFLEIGIFDELSQNFGKIQKIIVSDKNSIQDLNLDFRGGLNFLGLNSDARNLGGFFGDELEKSAQDDFIDLKAFGAIIENQIIFEALKEKILTTKNISVFSPVNCTEIKLIDDSADLQNGYKNKNAVISLSNDFEISAKLVLACDGRFSQIRKNFDIKIREKNYPYTAITGKIRHQFSHQNVAFEKFLGDETLAILPMSDLKQSAIVWIAPHQKAHLLTSLDSRNFNSQLQANLPPSLGECEFLGSKFFYPLVAIFAEKFFHKNLLLVGDASCGVHPVAGQGFNLAVSNIKILQKLISKNLFCGLDIGAQQLIDEYNQKAQINSKKMLYATDLLVSLFESEFLPVKIARKFGLGMINFMPNLQKFFINQAGGN